MCVFSGKRILKVTIIPKADGAVRVIAFMQAAIPAIPITEVRSEAVTGFTAADARSDLGAARHRWRHGGLSQETFPFYQSHDFI